MDSDERGINPFTTTYLQSSERILAVPGIEPATPSVLKSCTLMTEPWGLAGKGLSLGHTELMDKLRLKNNFIRFMFISCLVNPLHI